MAIKKKTKNEVHQIFFPLEPRFQENKQKVFQEFHSTPSRLNFSFYYFYIYYQYSTLLPTAKMHQRPIIPNITFMHIAFRFQQFENENPTLRLFSNGSIAI